MQHVVVMMTTMVAWTVHPPSVHVALAWLKQQQQRCHCCLPRQVHQHPGQSSYPVYQLC
jgi:hypothetical protein